MKEFIGGVIFGALVYPALSYCASILETATNLVVTKLSVTMANDARKLDDECGCTTHAIGFTADFEEYPEEEE